jgi:DNA repair protein RecN (Recombination protein N)
MDPLLAEAIAHYEKLQAELAELSGEGQSLEELEKTYFHVRKPYRSCTKLTQLRRAAAEDLEKRLIAQLKPLAMEKVQFQVALAPIAATASGSRPSDLLL